MNNIPHHIHGVIPTPLLTRIAESSHESGAGARATLDAMSALAGKRLLRTEASAPQPQTQAQAQVKTPKKQRNVYDAQHQQRLPGKLVMSEHKARGHDVEVNEAYDVSGSAWDFYSEVFDRLSVDGHGKRIDSSVHYDIHFDNAFWDGSQMIYGDGDGLVFNRFTSSPDVGVHELTHGVTQFTARLGYSGQTGAINEHLSDAMGIMFKQWLYGLTASESNWIIGEGLFTPAIHGDGLRSMKAPGTAYDDPILGRDPQPAHMRDYVETEDDNGGVHYNSGILNHALYLAAINLGGYTWDVLGQVWYLTMKERLRPDAVFNDFARATVDVAGEKYTNNGVVQRAIAKAWADVGLPVKLVAKSVVDETGPLSKLRPKRPTTKWRQRPINQ